MKIALQNQNTTWITEINITGLSWLNAPITGCLLEERHLSDRGTSYVLTFQPKYLKEG